jgi:FkbM family methyltransferase
MDASRRRRTVERIESWLSNTGHRRESGNIVARACRWISWGATLSLRLARHPAGSVGGTGAALTRFWFWQIWRRAVERPVLAKLSDGTVLLCPVWSSQAGQLVAVGFPEYREAMFLNTACQPADMLIDVGANIGVFAVPFARKGSQVVAFEPSAQARAVLLRNLRLNNVEHRAAVLPWAVSDVDGEQRFTTQLDVYNHLVAADDISSSRGSDETVSVACKRLDGLIDEMGLRNPSTQTRLFLKIDAEGHDLQVLQGGDELVSTFRPTIVVEMFDGSRAIRSWLADHGYSVYTYAVETRTLKAFPERWSGQGNFIAVPDEQYANVAGRLATAPVPAARAPSVAWLRPDTG